MKQSMAGPTTTIATGQSVENPSLSAARRMTPPEAPPGGSPQEMLTVMLPPGGWQLVNVAELWRYRELLYFLIWRDVKVRYKQTLLGASWAILQPVLMMAVFLVVGSLAKFNTGDIPYPIYVFSGLLPWTFFATAIASGGNSVVGAERMITKIYFPRLAIPFAAVGAAVVDFFIASAVLILMMVWYGFKGAPIHPGLGLLMVPVIFILILLTGTGVGSLLAALNVAYRDFRYVIPFLVQLWMFATPTIYLMVQNPGPRTRALMLINPMSGLIDGFRAAMLGGPLPWNHLAVSSVCAVGVFLLGCFYFRKVEDSFADVI
jgi:lipopolysaccharide transport system permease protein